MEVSDCLPAVWEKQGEDDVQTKPLGQGPGHTAATDQPVQSSLHMCSSSPATANNTSLHPTGQKCAVKLGGEERKWH